MSKSLKELIVEAGENEVNKGFRDELKDFAIDVALIHSELSEALEEYRNNHPLAEMRIENGKPEGVPSELADVIIRIFGLCHHHKIDLANAIDVKMAFNATRPHKHGGKKI